MKKFLWALGSAFLFAGSLSAQITIDKTNAIPTSQSVFAKDEVRTIKFDSLHTIFKRNFDSSSNLGFTSANFNGFGGAFIWDSTGSVHSGQVYVTPDSSGFMIMDSEAMSNTDTQRVYLTSAAFSTVNFNKLRVTISHYYNYSLNDSAADIYISKDSVNWTLVKSFSADALDHGLPNDFVSETFNIADSFLGDASVYVRFVYATTDAGQWAIDKISVQANRYTPGYSFFKAGGSLPKTWDLSNIEYDGGVRYYARKPAPAPYRFIDSIYNENLLGLQHTTYGLNYFTIDGILAHAHLTYGQEIMLNQLTGAIDTLAIPVQFHLPYVKTPIPYSSFHIKYPYPMTYNTRWGSDYAFRSQFFLQGESFLPVIGAKFLTCYRDARFIETDTIVGWGKMRVKSTGGNVESYIDVLQLKATITQMDSFWVDTSGMIDANKADRYAKFNNFMINQSGIGGFTLNSTHTEMRFIRIGEIHPLATVFLQDTFINRIEIHTAHPWPLGLEETVAAESADGITVYPNPLTGRTVNVSVQGATDGEWACEVLNSVGQKVATRQLSVSAGNTTGVVELPAVIAPGLYLLNITKDGKTFSVKPIQVQN